MVLKIGNFQVRLASTTYRNLRRGDIRVRVLVPTSQTACSLARARVLHVLGVLVHAEMDLVNKNNTK